MTLRDTIIKTCLVAALIIPVAFAATDLEEPAIATGTTVGVRLGALEYHGSAAVDVTLLVDAASVATTRVEANAAGVTSLEGVELAEPFVGSLDGRVLDIVLRAAGRTELKFTAVPSTTNGTTLLRITSVEYRDGSAITASGETIATLLLSHVDDELTVGFAYREPVSEAVTVALQVRMDTDQLSFNTEAVHDGDGSYSAKFTLPNLGEHLVWSATIRRGDVLDGTVGAEISFREGSAEGTLEKGSASPLVAAGGFHHLVVREVEIPVSRDILTPSYTGRTTCPESSAFDSATGETVRLQRYASRGSRCEPFILPQAEEGVVTSAAETTATANRLWYLPLALAGVALVLGVALFIARGRS